ncbi:MAG: hypothetical protein JO119_08630 [Acidobacteria bacterium]|nr:hypothetical protein [Acidobacteriota bacterium]
MTVARDDVDEDKFGRDMHSILRLLRGVLAAQGSETAGERKKNGNDRDEWARESHD